MPVVETLLDTGHDSSVESFLNSRIELVTQILNRGAFRPRDPTVTRKVRLLGEKYILPDSTLTGLENLDIALDLLKKGHNLIIPANHAGHADSPSVRVMLERDGHKSFADKIVYVAGLKFYEEELTGQLASAENIILVPAPSDYDDLEIALKQTMTDMEIDTIRQLRKAYRELGKAARTAAAAQQALLMYPEASRSRDNNSRMQQARPESAVLLLGKRSNGYILPLAIQGTANILAVEKVGSKLTLADARRAVITMQFGEPVSIKEIIKRVEQRELNKNQKAQAIVDEVMFPIAKMLGPDNVSDYYQSFFMTNSLIL